MATRKEKPKRWSRKGKCPSCNVGTGSKHGAKCTFEYGAREVKEKKPEPIHYGDYGNLDDDTLCELREELMDYLEKGRSQLFIHKLHELMEVERELTLREDQ